MCEFVFLFVCFLVVFFYFVYGCENDPTLVKLLLLLNHHSFGHILIYLAREKSQIHSPYPENAVTCFILGMLA